MVEQLPGVDPAKIHVNYNGIDLSEFAPSAEEREPFSVFSVGRFIEKKGFIHLVRAAAMLRDASLPIVCRIAGEGREQEHLEKEIRKHHLGDHVQLLGSLRQDLVREWMQRSACLVLPCIQAKDGNIDALPTVLLESMACGCPSISTRLSGIPEILENGESGLLVEPGDDAALAEAIRRVLVDKELAQKLSTQGRVRAVERFDGRKNVATMREWFSAVVGETGRPRHAAEVACDPPLCEPASQLAAHEAA
jgi:glycosyltransferase involved in cell wall biosynthesis